MDSHNGWQERGTTTLTPSATGRIRTCKPDIQGPARLCYLRSVINPVRIVFPQVLYRGASHTICTTVATTSMRHPDEGSSNTWSHASKAT